MTPLSPDDSLPAMTYFSFSLGLPIGWTLARGSLYQAIPHHLDCHSHTSCTVSFTDSTFYRRKKGLTSPYILYSTHLHTNLFSTLFLYNCRQNTMVLLDPLDVIWFCVHISSPNPRYHRKRQ